MDVAIFALFLCVSQPFWTEVFDGELADKSDALSKRAGGGGGLFLCGFFLRVFLIFHLKKYEITFGVSFCNTFLIVSSMPQASAKFGFLPIEYRKRHCFTVLSLVFFNSLRARPKEANGFLLIKVGESVSVFQVRLGARRPSKSPCRPRTIVLDVYE